MDPFPYQYHYQDEDSPALDQGGFPRLTGEARAPELVHVSEKNLSEIENVHGYVSHSHISPLKVSNLLPHTHMYAQTHVHTHTHARTGIYIHTHKRKHSRNTHANTHVYAHAHTGI